MQLYFDKKLVSQRLQLMEEAEGGSVSIELLGHSGLGKTRSVPFDKEYCEYECYVYVNYVNKHKHSVHYFVIKPKTSQIHCNII